MTELHLGPDADPPGDFVALARFHNPLEAQVLHGLLVSEGIPAVLGDVHQVQTNTLWATALGGVRVLVPAAFLARAQALMAEMQSGALAIEGDDDPALPKPVVATDAALWNPDVAAGFSTWLTPMFGATLLALNARTLGDRALQRSANSWLAASTLATVATLWLLRAHDASPGRMFQVSALLVPFTIVWYFASAHTQSSRIAKAHGRRYLHRSVLKAAAIAALLLWLVGASGVLQPGG